MRLIGELALELDGQELALPPGRRVRSLLAWLALNPGMHARREVAGRLWPDVLDESARASLRVALSALRGALGEHGRACLLADRDRVGLAGEPQVWVDALALRSAVAAGRLSEALEIADGDALLLELDHEWVYEAREDHRDLRARMLGALAKAAAARGDHEQATRFARERVSLDPLSEQASRELIERLAAAGDRAASLTAYEQARERLREELGVVPSAATRELVERVLHEGDAPTAPADDRPAPGGPAVRCPLPPPLARQPRGRHVGRGEALGRLKEAWARAGSEPRLALVAGESGIGKTRLVTELCRIVHSGGANVLFGRCPQEALLPYQPFVEAMRPLLAALPAGRAASLAGAGAGELGRLVPELADRLPGEPQALAPAIGEDPRGARYRLFESVARLLSAASAERPAVLALDDLHWAEAPTLSLLGHLLSSPEAPSLLVVGTYRASEVPADHSLAAAIADLRRDHPVDRISLSGLSEDGVAELVGDWMGLDTPAAFSRAVHERTEGNPLFVEELLRHLGESDAIPRHGGRWAPGAVADLGVPEGVKEVVGHRLARLSEGAGQALAAAAVLGPDFDLAPLEALVELDRDELLSALEEAAGGRIVREEPGAVGRYGFAHVLIRETIYGGLSSARRARMHARAASALGERSPSQPGPHLVEIAHHLRSAGPLVDPTQIIDSAARAGEWANSQLAYEEAAAQYEWAAGALATAGTDERRRCELLLALGEARWNAGDFALARDAFREAAELAERLGLGQELARAALGFGGRLGFELVVLNPLLISFLERALDRLGNEDSALRAQVTVRLGEALMFSPSRDRAAALSTEAVQMARRIGDEAVLAEVLNTANWVQWTPDNLEERLSRAREIVELADAGGATRVRIEGRMWLVSNLLELGDMEAFERELQGCVALVEQVRQPYYLWVVDVLRVVQAMFTEPLEGVERLAWRALETGQSGQIPAAAHLFGTQIFHLRLQQGRAVEVRAAAQAYADAFPAVPALRCGLALLYCEDGHPALARRELERVATNAFEDIPRDFVWLSAMDLLTEVCAHLGDERRAEQLYALLEPYADRHVVASAFAIPRGSVERLLGVLAATLSRFDDAALHFEAALERNAETSLPYAVASTQHDYARMLLARDRPGDRARALDMLADALGTAERAGIVRLAERSLALRREAEREATEKSPRRRTFSELASQIGDEARAAISTRGRTALAELTGDVSDQGLERRFGSRLAQRALLTAMARSFQPRLALGFEGEVQLELTHDSAGEGGRGSDWWTIEVEGKRAIARRRAASHPAVTMHCSVPEFVRVFSGVTNPIGAWVEGRLRVEGDVLLAARLVDMFGGVNPSEALSQVDG